VRDQKPLIESKLAKSLKGYTLEEWYRLLNRQVFFWLTKERLNTLLCAREYRDTPHAVLTLQTLPFVKRYEDRIVLSPMNSGNTQPIAHPRGPATFRKMQDYPFNERAHRGDWAAPAAIVCPVLQAITNGHSLASLEPESDHRWT
jgi:hypothetical protein